MKKITRCLAMAVMLIFLFSASALAVDTLNLLAVGVREGGYLNLIAATDYTDDQDMQFKAATENGELEITTSLVLSKEGTSWFFVLDYYRDTQFGQIKGVQDRALAKMSDMILSKDEGALVLSSADPAITLEKAASLKETLKATPGTTDGKELPGTIRKVMNYINDHGADLMPNVAVVVLTPALADINVADIENTLAANSGITTHILCVMPSESTVGANRRETASQLQGKARLTVGGTGYLTEKATNDEADKAVERIKNAERRKLFMLLKPKSAANVGKKLTLTQTTAGGKTLTADIELSDETVENWKKQAAVQPVNPVNPDNPNNPDNPGGTDVPDVGKIIRVSGGMPMQVNTNYNPPVPAASGMGTELIIGIILGVVIIALVIILLLSRRKKTKKPQSAAAVYASSSSQSSSGVTVTLNGANGAVLKAQMKNNRLTIGRDKNRGAMLAVPNDGKLSGLHATLTKQGSTMTLTDNNSTNGTKVNGNKVTGPVTLQQNDTVTMGSTTYTITWR